METPVETALQGTKTRHPGVQVRMLGPLAVLRHGVALELPASRKVRALLAYLAMASRPIARSRLCELLWDIPNDPRGELRWSLSKIRGILDEPGLSRVTTSGDTITLDLSDCFLDTKEVEATVAGTADDGISTLSPTDLRALLGLFEGEFLDGLEIDRSPHFGAWLVAQRRRFRGIRITLLQHLLASLPAGSGEASALLDSWLEIAPFDIRAHQNLLGTLSARGETAACLEHLESAARLFADAELDFDPVRTAWATILGSRTGVSPWVQTAPTAPAPISDTTGALAENSLNSSSRRASIAVMPFQEQSVTRSRLVDGLTHDIIARLAKLRSLFVIARGSVFALFEQGMAPTEAAARLNVDYVASGTVRLTADRLIVDVELVEARTARIVWADRFDQKSQDALGVLDEIGNRIVAAIASEIELAERNRALLKLPNSLDAWEAYHRGLWHMYRFTKAENEQAQHFFEMAARLDPTFVRAHAGLSFTHWQSAFQRWQDRTQASNQAFVAASQGLLVDEHDPAAHWAMGRALWLQDRQDESLTALERAVELSPNFALGHYAVSFVQSQAGDALAAIRSSDHSRHLSPFDPMLFGMLGTRAMAHVRLGQYEDAAEWAMKAAARPNAHANILAIAAYCLALAGRVEEGRAFATSVRRMLPGYSVANYLQTFRFTPDAATLFRKSASLIGLD